MTLRQDEVLMKNSKAKKIAVPAVMIALAFTLSYLESLLPLNLGIPGIKLGLANFVTVTAIYLLPPGWAFAIALVRILLSGLTFGNAFSLIYSLCGGLLSFGVMTAFKRTKLSPVGVSMLGGISHNAGQLAAAAVLLGTPAIAYYMPVLLIAGTATGLLIGIVADQIIKRLKRINFDKN